MRIMIVTDAWAPQVNGVVRTLEALKDHLERMGNEVAVIAPTMFRTVALPTYQEIRLALWANRPVARMINDMRPHAIHIATEGPLGLAARRFCLRRDHPFTTSLHTRFPEYVHARTGFPISWGYWFLRMFHKPASAVMVAAPSVRDEMETRGFRNLRLWSRGVDTEKFRPLAAGRDDVLPYPRPIWLSVGRIAVEKNIEAFLRLDLPGTKVVVGDGPLKASVETLYPDTVFLGARFGDDLARIYGASDVFVFPSRTDTFGLVNVEALACGTPVAAYPVHGPKDIITVPNVGSLDEDLATACHEALTRTSRTAARDHALSFSWEACTRQFLVNLDLPGFDEAYWAESAKLPD
ncbi:MAG: glycosyltransferase family 4 protein [Alphaproteobacteria bacterium]